MYVYSRTFLYIGHPEIGHPSPKSVGLGVEKLRSALCLHPLSLSYCLGLVLGAHDCSCTCVCMHVH